MRKLIARYQLLFGLLVLVVGCATPGAPTGGPVDRTAPQVVRFEPEKLSRNFDGKVIQIFFDEWVDIKDAQRQVIISPPVDPLPDIIARKDELTIRFKGDLKPNTTYSIFFGDAIRDMKEGNATSNIQYVFSTGPEIDSLEISGKVIIPEGEKLPENSFVMLYESEDDSIVSKEKPLYAIQLKDKETTFKFSYLPSKIFKVVALSDNNRNFLYDLPTEWIGAFAEMIQVDSNVSGIEVPLSLPEEERFKIKEYNTSLLNGVLNLTFNKAYNPILDTISIETLLPNTLSKKKSYFTTDKASFFVGNDSSSTTCIIKKSGILVDTIKVRRDPKGLQNGILSTYPQVSGKNSSLSLNAKAAISFQSSLPFELVMEEGISIVDSLGEKVSFQIRTANEDWKFELIPELFESMVYQVRISDSVVRFVNGTYSGKMEFGINVLPPIEGSVLKAKVSLPQDAGFYVFSFKTAQGKILHERLIDGDSTLLFEDKGLMAGDYYIEVLEDLNRSGTWNGSSYWRKRSAERVWRSDKITLKENWDQDLEFKVDFSKPVFPLPPPSEEKVPVPAAAPAAGIGSRDGSRPMFDR
jgi:hypothetical protein